MESVGSLFAVTDRVTDWLAALVEAMPDLVPRRTDPAQEALPIAAGWLWRFVHDVVTTNSATRDSPTNIQIFLIESALDSVDREAVARDPRFRSLNWSHAGPSAITSRTAWAR